MENPLQKNEIFNTPESLEGFRNSLSYLPEDQFNIAVMYSMMAWNLASKIVDEEFKDILS